MTTYIPPQHRRAGNSEKFGINLGVYFGVFHPEKGEKYLVLRDAEGHRINFLNLVDSPGGYASSIKKEFLVVNCIDYITNKEELILKKETLKSALRQYYEKKQERQGAIDSLTTVLKRNRELVTVSGEGALILTEPCITLLDFGNKSLNWGCLSEKIDGEISKITMPPIESVRSMAQKIYEIVLNPKVTSCESTITS